MLEVVRELVDAVHSLRAITDNRRAELHTQLDQTAEDITGTSGPTGRALADTMLKPAEPAAPPKHAAGEPDVPAGA